MRVTKLLVVAAVAVAAMACNGTSPTAPSATVAPDEASGLVAARSSNDLVPIPTCRDITRVQLQVSRSPRSARIQATYFSGRIPVTCTFAPRWSSRPRGRIAQTRDPFIVNVSLTRPPTVVQVTAQAPNGVTGSILVQ